MTDTERLDWIDEPFMLPKVMHFWLQNGSDSVREAIDLFAAYRVPIPRPKRALDPTK